MSEKKMFRPVNEADSDNPAALRLYQKLGFQVEGTLREYFQWTGAPH